MTAGFREFRVADKVVESRIITSFYLEPVDGGPVWDVAPGQYLTIRIPLQGEALLRTYSVSGDPNETRHHRITVKREGAGSSWLHDHLNIGDVVELAAPRGSFVLDQNSTRPVLLLSGGVGLTPMVSMLHSLRKTGRDVHFLHACENGQVHALRDEVMACASDRIKPLFIYRKPDEADIAAQLFTATGVIDRAFMRANVPIGDYDAYICGPTPFMAAVYSLLQELGVRKERIAYEFFGKASALTEAAAAPVRPQAASRAAPSIRALTFLTDPDAWAAAEEGASAPEPSANGSGDQVTFRKSGTAAHWDGRTGSLLELAEDSGLNPEFSCRAGICNACKCGLVAGEVEYFEQPLIPPEAGQVLICCARPKGPVTLDI